MDKQYEHVLADAKRIMDSQTIPEQEQAPTEQTYSDDEFDIVVTRQSDDAYTVAKDGELVFQTYEKNSRGESKEPFFLQGDWVDQLHQIASTIKAR